MTPLDDRGPTQCWLVVGERLTVMVYSVNGTSPVMLMAVLLVV